VHEPAVGKTSKAQPDRRDCRPGLAIADIKPGGDGQQRYRITGNRRAGNDRGGGVP